MFDDNLALLHWNLRRALEEQDIVVERFNAAALLIAALRSQLTAARRVKQSLLQNLLTGKIRLKP